MRAQFDDEEKSHLMKFGYIVNSEQKGLVDSKLVLGHLEKNLPHSQRSHIGHSIISFSKPQLVNNTSNYWDIEMKCYSINDVLIYSFFSLRSLSSLAINKRGSIHQCTLVCSYIKNDR